jgi:hypothetical protein
MTFTQPEKSARALVSAFPVGKTVQISVNPSDVDTGVLITGKPEHMVVIRRAGVAAVVAGVVLLALGLLRDS